MTRQASGGNFTTNSLVGLREAPMNINKNIIDEEFLHIIFKKLEESKKPFYKFLEYTLL